MTGFDRLSYQSRWLHVAPERKFLLWLLHGGLEGEGFKVYLDRARRRPLPDDQIELEIFHGGIQHFFHGNGHAVDFIHKKVVEPVEIGEDGGKIAAALQHRARR